MRLRLAFAGVAPGVDQRGPSGAIKRSGRDIIVCVIQAMQFHDLSCLGDRFAGVGNNLSILIKGRDSSSARASVRYDELEWYLSIV